MEVITGCCLASNDRQAMTLVFS